MFWANHVELPTHYLSHAYSAFAFNERVEILKSVEEIVMFYVSHMIFIYIIF